MNRCYEKNLLVEYSYCDPHNRMTLTYLLKEAQQISMEHCDRIGLGKQHLLELNKVFLLAKLRVRVHRMPLGGELVTIKTLPYMPVRLQYPRFTELYDRDGKLLVEIDSRWILVDTVTRRIVRRPPPELPLEFPSLDTLEDWKPERPESLVPIGQEKVRYSMTDSNGHLNNAVYADLACNQAEEALVAGSPVRRFTIFYHHEALYGQTVALSAAREGNAYFLTGALPDGLCFESKLELEELESK